MEEPSANEREWLERQPRRVKLHGKGEEAKVTKGEERYTPQKKKAPNETRLIVAT
jgi:hypothetical protein